MRAVATDANSTLFIDKTLKGGTNKLAKSWALTEGL